MRVGYKSFFSGGTLDPTSFSSPNIKITLFIHFQWIKNVKMNIHL